MDQREGIYNGGRGVIANLRHDILNHKHKAQLENWKWSQTMSSQSLPPSDIISSSTTNWGKSGNIHFSYRMQLTVNKTTKIQVV